MLPFYRKALNDKLVERIRKNPKYSLRAFARAIEVDASILSKVLRGERYFSEELAIRVLDRIDLSYEEREWFLSSLARARVEAGLRRSSPAQKRRLAELARERSRELTRELTIDQFKIVADWYHYAILELTRVEGFRNEPAWIAGRLGCRSATAP